MNLFRKPRLSRRSGFTLLELCISLLVFSLMMGGAMVMTTDLLTKKKVKTDQEKIVVIQAAIDAYAVRNGKLPCVASRTTTLGTSTFGRMVLADCYTDSSVPAGTARVANAAGKYSRIGVLPVRDLLLRDEYMYDSFGNRFTYAVTENLTSIGTYVNGGGGLSIGDGNGNNITPRAAYLVFSHGKDGKGVYGMDSGALKVACGASTNLDVENCDDDTDFTRTDYNDGNVAAKYFDDSLIYNTKLGVNMCYRIDGNTAPDAISTKAYGDINGDGYTDIVLSSYVANSHKGYIYVVFGTSVGIPNPINVSALNGANGFRIDGTVTESGLGYRVTVGDVNGDGYDDIITTFYTHSSTFNSYVYVIFGKASGWTATSLMSAYVNGTNGFRIDMGTSYIDPQALTTGDFNGDGNDDIAVTRFHDLYGVTGYVWVVFGQKPWPSGTSTFNVSSINGTNGFSFRFASPTYPNYTFIGQQLVSGDINGDGKDDLLMLQAGMNNVISGYVFVVFGAAGGWSANMSPNALMDGTLGFRLDGGAMAGYIPIKTLATGDVNGDGKADILIGDSNTASSQGMISVIYGQAAGTWAATSTINSYINGTQGFRFTGDNNDQLWYARGVTRLNADAYGDMILLAGEASGYQRAVVVYGKASWTTTTQLSTIVDGTKAFGINSTVGDLGASFSGSVDSDALAEIGVWVPTANSSGGYNYGIYGKALNWSANVDLESYCAAP